MSLEDYLPAVMIIIGIFFLFKYFTKSSVPHNPDSIPGINNSTVETIHAAFPDVPLNNLIYSLSKTRSGQRTSEEIIERGYLPNPPANFVIPSSLQPVTTNPPSAPSSPTTSKREEIKTGTKGVSLIDRYGLKSRVPSTKGKEVAIETIESDQSPGQGQNGKGKWEESREGREKGLRERKEKMILEARRRLMEKQAQEVST